MTASGSYQRQIWQDRFQRPSPRLLRQGLPESARRIFEALRRSLLEIEGVAEELVWHGECWRWCLEYRLPRGKEALAVLIPSPLDLQLAVPLDREVTRTLPVHRMKRVIRDGLELAQDPFDTRWCVWSVTGMNLVGDLREIVEFKLNNQVRRVG